MAERPPRSGRIVRVVAPSGPVTEGDLEAGEALLREKGFTVEEGSHVRCRAGYLAGADPERLEDLQAALDDPRVDVVWFARGGYGVTRLLGALSPVGLKGAPKVIAGYSDATALFAWAQAIPGVRRLYAPSLQELGREGVCNLPSLWAALEGTFEAVPGKGGAPAGPFPVCGGCLSLLTVLAGTRWEPKLEGRWLFFEDVGEPLYRIDRMLTHLHQAGWFEKAAGFLLGGFPGMGSGEEPGQVAERVRELDGAGKPLVAGLPLGHIKGKSTLPLGVPASWDGKRLLL